MNKLVLALAIVFALGVTVSSCKTHKDKEKKEIAADVYQCPMDCEDGKTYHEPGKCPVCDMDLKMKEDHDDGHDHEKDHD